MPPLTIHPRSPSRGGSWRGRAASLALGLVLVVAGPGGPPPAAAQTRPASQCVACHARLPEASGVGHGFTAWRGSRHGAAGVGCEACHGGNAAATDKAAAHRGVVRSGDTASAVFFRRIPDTCGRCHASEAGYFRSSVHFARLRSDGHGPNCVTCHGAMATSVLTPERVLETCSACHSATGVAPVGKSREAAQVLGLVRATNILFDVVAASAGARGGRARILLDDADRHLAAAAEVWHSFRLDSATARLGAARTDLVGAWVALGHPAPSDTRARRMPGRGPR
jgi:hypothetical protein